MQDAMKGFLQAVQNLPIHLRQELLCMPEQEQTLVEEIRLRVGQPVRVHLAQGERILGKTVREQDLEHTLELASQASIHQALPKLRQGYLPLKGGHRMGVCGSVILQDGKIQYIRPVFSLNLRIARSMRGVGSSVLRQICAQGGFKSTLILAPPGYGKTTLLRDLICGLSNGECDKPYRVGLADERGELGAMCDGVPQMEIGQRTDVLDGCPKAQGLMMLLRGMNPQILAMDEITAPEDVEALRTAAGCGVSLLSSAHGQDWEDLQRRPMYRQLLRERIFCKAIYIDIMEGERVYRVEELE